MKFEVEEYFPNFYEGVTPKRTIIESQNMDSIDIETLINIDWIKNKVQNGGNVSPVFKLNKHNLQSLLVKDGYGLAYIKPLEFEAIIE